MSTKSFDPYKFRKQNKIQTGRGLYGRFRGSYMIPVNPNSTQTESTLIQNKLVAPVEADAEIAETELKENNNKVVFGLLPQKAVNGDYTINPFDFKHFNMESVSLKMNSVDVYGSPMKLYFGTNRNYTAAYVRLFEICEKWNKDTGLNISLLISEKDTHSSPFTLNPNDFQEEFLNLVRNGNARLEMRFKSDTTETKLLVLLSDTGHFNLRRNKRHTNSRTMNSLQLKKYYRITSVYKDVV
ncbi:unnamed protein product [Mytilus edulis]|uniref:Uncharacterized protein n=1 Tax=Mytilus edulis TaxID=6550 RepID=A0A8S3TXN9_MYTED|nr:unnamed protein product [Mytilus edulis]